MFKKPLFFNKRMNVVYNRDFIDTVVYGFDQF